jgi:ferredoxin
VKVRVVYTRCEGHGQCGVVDMDLFPLDDARRSAVGSGVVVPEREEVQAWTGVEACPMRALSIEP